MEAVSESVPPAVDAFETNRPRLLGLAYRLVGTLADAEDLVQDAHVRWWQMADERRAAVVVPAAYLTRMVTNLALDHLKSARVKRESYVGPWMPEPVCTDDGLAFGVAFRGPVDVGGISLAFMVLLERLSPLERAVLVLTEVFDHTPAELAELLERTPAAIRQVLHRARAHIADDRPRYAPDDDAHARMMGAFFGAVASADVAAVEALLAADVRARSDGGGKANAALKILEGPSKVARFFVGILPKSSPTMTTEVRHINGLPALVGFDGGRAVMMATCETDGERIHALLVVVNPDKLRHLRPTEAL